MAQLNSPGVSVTVIDESFYTPAAPGTVPLIVVASEENKPNGSNTGTAPGTLKANAGKVWLLTSQKDLVDTFGVPMFELDNNNSPVHASELNEYGLQAAYSFLGVSNSAFVVRADVDLGQLTNETASPSGKPVDGTVWFDTASSLYGIFQWNASPANIVGGQSFKNIIPSVITEQRFIIDTNNYQPKSSYGKVGDYAIVAITSLNKLWYKKPETSSSSMWVEVGSSEWVASWPTVQGTVSNASNLLLTSDTLTITLNGGTPHAFTNVTSLTALSASINTANVSGLSSAIINNKLHIYSTGADLTISGSSAAKAGITSGVYLAPQLVMSKHTQLPTFKRADLTSTVNGVPSGAIWIKTTTPNLGAHWSIKSYSSADNKWATVQAPLYSSNTDALAQLDSTGGGIHLPVNTMYVKYNDSEGTHSQHSTTLPSFADFKVYRRAFAGLTKATSAIITNTTLTEGSYSFTIKESLVGNSSLSSAKTIQVSVAALDGATTVSENIANAINTAGLINVVADVNSNNSITISHITGGDISIVDTGASQIITHLFDINTTVNFYENPNGIPKSYIISNWTSLTADKSTGFATASAHVLTSTAENGRLWYNQSISEVDIMVHNGTTWVGYANAYPGTNATGPIISATKPTTQSGGTPLVNHDIWINTSDIENFPLINVYNGDTKTWVLVDNTDQTSENGVVFADARWDLDGTSAEAASIVDLLTSNFLDFDAPDPMLYPKGMLLWNLRRSEFNVKEFVKDYVDKLGENPRQSNELMTDYYAHRWVTVSGNQENGAGSFGRKAQRKVIIQKMQALLNSNQEIRDEDSRIFNLIAAPGYSELIGEMKSLNYDRGLTALVIGDTPARLTPDATTLSNWGKNVKNAPEDNDDGLTTTDPYLAVFYPWGYTSDNLGNNIVVPPSHMILRTIALSDQVSYPWFAPAGTRRGIITNASAVGYVDAEGEFKSIALNEGQRDTLADIHVNPITFISGTGLVNYGQKTRQLAASSLDRINVARLVIYLRMQLTRLSKPFIFEPNDTITRNEIKQQVEKLLLELVGQRALYDFLVVCDTSNNTPARIDRNELYVDIAIEPVKAVEFIYIPLRLENTGAIAKMGR